MQFGRKLQEIVQENAKRLSSQARRDLSLPDEAGRHAMIISSGLVALYRDAASTQRRIVALRYPGDVVQPHESSLRVHALLQTEALVAEAAAFEDLLSDPELKQLAAEAQLRSQLIAYEWLMRDAMDSASRTAHFLCEHALRRNSGYPKTLHLELTQAQIGEITVQTSVNVNRVLRVFEHEKILVPIASRQYRADWPELRRLGCFDQRYLD